MSTRYLVRPPPLDGESLSSWRQRLAWANGYRLFPVLDERTRRTDPDIKLSVREVRWLADLSMLSTDAIASMTTEGAPLQTDIVIRSRHPLWVIPSGMRKELRWGSMFCPACLAEGDEPYFRLQWRLAYNLSCKKHRRGLIDQCPECGRPPWPTGSSVQMEMSSGHTSHAFCWACGCDLRLLVGLQERADDCLDGDALVKMRSLLEDRIGTGTSDQDLLQGLHALCQLNLRLRRMFSEHRRNSIEMYSIDTRRMVIGQAFAYLHDWPNHFIQEVTKRGLTRASFNGQYRSLPPWIKAVVDKDLARQNRSVTKEVVRHTFLGLQNELGRIPCQAEMRRVLGEAGDRFVRALVKKRTLLSEDEVLLMQQRASALRKTAQKRIDMLRAFRRSVLCLSISASSGMTLKAVSELSAEEVLNQVRSTPALLEGWLWGGEVVEVDQLASCVGGKARQLLKQSRIHMRSLMQTLPKDVLRSEAVLRVNRPGNGGGYGSSSLPQLHSGV